MLQSRPRSRKTVAVTDEENNDTEQVSTPVLLDLLGDEYTRAVLRAVVDQPRSGADVAEQASVSKPTAFRRLNRLEEAGLVTVRQHIDTEGGHHHKVYEARPERLDVELDNVLESFEE